MSDTNNEVTEIDASEQPPVNETNTNVPDVSTAALVIDDVVEALQKMEKTRELSVAITHLQTGRLWLNQHIRVN